MYAKGAKEPSRPQVTPMRKEGYPIPLSDVKIKNAKAAAKPMKLYDERGLFLIVMPNGGKRWRFKYRFDDKEKLLSLGVYPDISLKDARLRRDEARKLLAHFIDPGLRRKAHDEAKLLLESNSFEIVAREWYARYAPVCAEHHGDRILRRLERDVFPWIGSGVSSEVTAPELLSIARRIRAARRR